MFIKLTRFELIYYKIWNLELSIPNQSGLWHKFFLTLRSPHFLAGKKSFALILINFLLCVKFFIKNLKTGKLK